MKEWQRANPEKVAKAHQRYRRRYPDRIAEAQRRYQQENLQKVALRQKRYRITHAQEEAERLRRHRLANLYRYAAKQAARKTAKNQRALPWLTQAHLAEIEGMYHFAKVMGQITGEKYHVDHIEPLQGRDVSGLHVPWNLRVISAAENLRKSNRRVEA